MAKTTTGLVGESEVNMGKLKVNLDTYSQIQKFVNIINANNIKATLATGDGQYRVNARSLLGALATMDWSSDVWIESEEDIYSQIEEFVD